MIFTKTESRPRDIVDCAYSRAEALLAISSGVSEQIRKARSWLRLGALQFSTSPFKPHSAGMSSASPPLIPKPETRYRNESGVMKERSLLDMMEPVDDAIFHNWYKISVSGASRRRSEASLTRGQLTL
jgi:hypothetical protein